MDKNVIKDQRIRGSKSRVNRNRRRKMVAPKTETNTQLWIMLGLFSIVLIIMGMGIIGIVTIVTN